MSIDRKYLATVFATFDAAELAIEVASQGFPNTTDPIGSIVDNIGTIDDCVITVCNLRHGAIGGDEMTGILMRAFPEHRIGERHGPHYLSLTRMRTFKDGRTGYKIGGHVPIRYEALRKGGGIGPRQVVQRIAPAIDITGIDRKVIGRIAKMLEGTALGKLFADRIDAPSDQNPMRETEGDE